MLIKQINSNQERKLVLYVHGKLISPMVNLEKLIINMMSWTGVTEEELKEKENIDTPFGERLSYKYLTWVRNNSIKWNIPTQILYGEKDNLQSIDIITEFAEKINAQVTVMKKGEHWFHTDEQMKFLSNWILSK